MAGLWTILLSLLLLLALLAGLSWLGRLLHLPCEWQRKLVHLSLGSYALTFPWIFQQAWQVTLLCILAVGLLLAVRWIPALRLGLGNSLHGVKRDSQGEIYFALAIAILFFLAHGQVVLYLLPLLILTLSDAAAALVGSTYGRKLFFTVGQPKSWEGSGFFFLTAWQTALIALLLLTSLPRGEVIIIALLIAAYGTLIEGFSWLGLDNLLIPLGLFLLLQHLLPQPLAPLLAGCLGFFLLLGLGLWLAKEHGWQRHTLITMVTILFFFWTIGGWSGVVAPLAVVLGHWRLAEKETAAFGLAPAMIGLALFWYLVGQIFAVGYAFPLTLGFATCLVQILLTQGWSHDRILPLSWLITLPRLLVEGGLSWVLPLWSLALLAAILLLAHRFPLPNQPPGRALFAWCVSLVALLPTVWP